MATKRKISQDELRRLMGEQKKKLLTSGTKKIESPLAKYDKSGQLTCIVCETVVRSEAVWTVHINTKNHRENLIKKAKRKESPVETIEPPKKIFAAPFPPNSVKLKSILKNSQEVPRAPLVPPDFFNSKSKICSNESSYAASATMEIEPTTVVASGSKELEVTEESTSELPEGFFDDPKLDAKVRHVEYKDPIEEEWEQFQKEIKEETSKAQLIISEDQEEATNERQIDEIDEQMRHWSRVMSMEQKKKEAVPAVVHVKEEGDEDAMEEDSFDEFVDWRSKGSFL